MKLRLGKLPPAILEKYFLSMVGAGARDLVVRPGIGLDFGVIRLREGGYLIVSSDPVTGVRDRVGWYAVNVSANDVATSGNRPRFLQSVILFPENASLTQIRKTSAEIQNAATKLGITIVGGHTELTPQLTRPIVVTTAFTSARAFVTAADAKEGDTVMITKSAGIEGTVIFGTLAGRIGGKVGPEAAKTTTRFSRMLSTVEESEQAYRTGYVRAMHDCTEGGVLGAAYEMAVASNLGFEIEQAKIPVAGETRAICNVLGIDPLRLISSGSLLISVEHGKEEKLVERLGKIGTRVSSIGRFARNKKILIRPDGSEEQIRAPPVDELWRLASHVDGSTILNM